MAALLFGNLLPLTEILASEAPKHRSPVFLRCSARASPAFRPSRALEVTLTKTRRHEERRTKQRVISQNLPFAASWLRVNLSCLSIFRPSFLPSKIHNSKFLIRASRPPRDSHETPKHRSSRGMIFDFPKHRSPEVPKNRRPHSKTDLFSNGVSGFGGGLQVFQYGAF
jgi:hypothetical protein